MNNKTNFQFFWIALLLCVFGVATLFNAGSERSDFEGDVGRASRAAMTNNDSASGAPQQQVVNGWHTNELLEIQIKQDAMFHQRQLLAITLFGTAIVLAIGAVGGFSISRSKAKDEDDPDEPSPSDS